MGYDSGGLSDHDNAMLDIRNQRLEREAYDREITDLKSSITELEAELKLEKHQHISTKCACKSNGKLADQWKNDYTALVDGLRELAEKWRTEDTSYYGEGHAAADDVEELLGKENDDG